MDKLLEEVRAKNAANQKLIPQHYTQEEIDAALADPEFKKIPLDHPGAYIFRDEVNTCVEFLRKWPPTKATNKKRAYGWKHTVERWCRSDIDDTPGTYIGSESFTAAAFLEGLDIKVKKVKEPVPGSINEFITIYSTLPKRKEIYVGTGDNSGRSCYDTNGWEELYYGNLPKAKYMVYFKTEKGFI